MWGCVQLAECVGGGGGGTVSKDQVLGCRGGGGQLAETRC